ncbi:hypothetical protein [Hymenobacter nivis]|uniref:Macroglobulin domain-containing protein n=1 Tax=Hymenobacter nivis TaxID=1850093 RepID=A0A2Z3GU95_9BACT|nr:hypothetical protein [Hymenobacter nivis]AWM35016.1 hypothetical protein DDQ68_20945 [Hymenobacter nivis]
MRFLLILWACLAPALAAQAGPPRLLLDVARFRNLNQVEKGAEVEVYVTVPTQSLTYRQRAPRAFQSAATVTLEILRADGKPAYKETVILKPPVINDTTLALKNPVSFLKRIPLPDGHYTLRGTVRDQYRAANGEAVVERPLVLEAPVGPTLSDVLLLARPAVKSNGDDTFLRGGYLLTRAPSGFFGRGADNLYFYTELQGAPAGQPLRLHYHLAAPDGTAADADAPLTPQAGRPTTIIGQLPFGPLPEGEFTLLVDVYSGKKLLTSHRATGQRSTTEYAPAGAASR